MIAKEQLKEKLIWLRRQSKQTATVQLSVSVVTLLAEAAIHFFLAAVLAGAVVLGSCAPFGVALVAAAGSGLCGAAALPGACLGYLSMLGFAQGLCYVAASILTFAVCFAFYDIKFFTRGWVMPVLAGAITAFSRAIVLAQSGWGATDVTRYTLEVVLVVTAAWCYRAILAPMRARREDRLLSPARQAGLLVLVATLAMALSSFDLYKGTSPGRCLAVLAVLCSAWQGGVAAGAVVGVVMGAAMDLTGSGIPLYTMSIALAALGAGLCRGRRRWRCALAFTLVSITAALGAWNLDVPVSLLSEVLLAAGTFLLLPERPLRQLGVWLSTSPTGPGDPGVQKLLRRRLESTAQAFRTLGDSLRTAFRPPQNDNDISTVFDRAAARICLNCPLRARCWKQEYTSTFNALNDATQAMVERGKAQAGDFPTYFSDRCLHFSSFVTAVNEELTALFYRRQYNARVRESRSAVCRQYTQLSDLLHTAAAELAQELTPDPVGDRLLRQKVTELGLEVRTAVFRDGRGLLRAEVEGPGASSLSRPGRLSELSQTLGVPLRCEQEREGEQSLQLLEQEPLMAVAGVAAQKKSGETVSGDAGTYFKRADGKLYVLLCDGMGSGPAANRESSLAVRLLEQFLQSGVQPRQALATLSSALALRGDDNGGFTTVDLLQLDLFTGEGELFKMGGAPTYIKKGGVVQRLSGTSLPAGLGEGESDGAALDQFALRLTPGDTVLMVSDGICGTGDDGWMKESLAQFDGVSPKDLARDLITRSPQEGTDDRTALVVRLEKRS